MPQLAPADRSVPFMPLLGIAGAVLAVGTPEIGHANTFTLPTDLQPGDHYRLMFISSTQRDATSTDIATYNSFVNGVGQSNTDLPATTWVAIASTATVNAVDNIACAGACATAPIYLVDGNRVANNTAALFDASDLLVSVIKTQTGGTPGTYWSAYAWTGSATNGTASTNPMGSSNVTFGWSDVTTAGSWLASPYTDPATTNYSVYGISGDLVVPASVPEPGSLALIGAGLLGLAGLRRRAD